LLSIVYPIDVELVIIQPVETHIEDCIYAVFAQTRELIAEAQFRKLPLSPVGDGS
jgi:hypothetical protein